MFYVGNTCKLFIHLIKGSGLGLILYGEMCILEGSGPKPYQLQVTYLPQEGVSRVILLQMEPSYAILS